MCRTTCGVELSQLAQLQVFLTLLSSLALRASPPSKLAGDLVTVVLFLVPCIGVVLETPLLEVMDDVFVKLKGWLSGLVKFRPPTLKLDSTVAPSNITTGTSPMPDTALFGTEGQRMEISEKKVEGDMDA